MESLAEIKKTWSTRKSASKFATALIVLAITIYTAIKDKLVQLYQIIFARLNAFLPFPGASPTPGPDS
jgi:hypothetical protein